MRKRTADVLLTSEKIRLPFSCSTCDHDTTENRGSVKSKCAAALLAAEGGHAMSHETDVVTVFRSGNLALVAFAKSLLDGAEILYIVKGEYLQNVVGMSYPLVGFNPLVGPVEIQVHREDEATARELLAAIHESGGSAD